MAAPVEVEGTVIGRAELAGGRFLLTLAAEGVARLAGPGQFAMLRCGDGHDPYLRRALPFLHASGETVSFLFSADEVSLTWLSRRRLDDPVSLIGPLGHGFGLAPGTRRLLLATAGGPAAPLLSLAGLALDREVSVSLALGAKAAAELAPIIPEAVELLPAPDGGAGAVWRLAAETLPWADQVAVAGPQAEVVRLAPHLVARPAGFVQCYIDAPRACGLGWCGSCLTETRRGPRRTCIGGPVFDLREFIG